MRHEGGAARDPAAPAHADPALLASGDAGADARINRPAARPRPAQRSVTACALVNRHLRLGGHSCHSLHHQCSGALPTAMATLPCCPDLQLHAHSCSSPRIQLPCLVQRDPPPAHACTWETLAAAPSLRARSRMSALSTLSPRSSLAPLVQRALNTPRSACARLHRTTR